MEIFSFNDSWTSVESSKTDEIWVNEQEDVLSVNYFNTPPNVGGSLEDISTIRAFYREKAASSNLAMLEISTLKIKELQALRTLFKVQIEPNSFAYIGSVNLLFLDLSYVIKFSCSESGITGTRETTVMIIEDAQNPDGATGSRQDWEADPYDTDFHAPFMANKADDVKYDSQFPDHPLSRLRGYLDRLPEHMNIPGNLYDLKPFV